MINANTSLRHSKGLAAMATIYGTDDDDKIVQNKYSAVKIYAYDGDDDIYLNRTDKFGGDNIVYAGYGNDMVVNYFEGGNSIYLGEGNDLYVADIRAYDASSYDIVYGGGGNDRFEVNSYASVYKGESGNDTFVSAGFDNSFYGGSGIDTISYETRSKGVTIDLGAKAATTSKGHYEDLFDIENATGSNGSDVIYGTSGRNVLKGLAGADTLRGFDGHDDLYGGSGNDNLFGGNGDDDLDGGSGSDILVGGRGWDYLTGGTGADTFDFDSIYDTTIGSKRDVITDFHRSEYDVVDLSTIDANINRGGNQDFTFIGTQGFSGHAGELRFSGGIVSGDVDGDGVSDFQIKMSGVTKMYADDFFL